MSFLALPHIGFVIAAYAITFVVVTLLIGRDRVRSSRLAPVARGL